MPDQPSPRRRFQFRLRTLMIGVTLFCVVFGGYVGWQKKIVSDRQAMVKRILDEGVTLDRSENNSVPWIRRLLGDEAIEGVTIYADRHPTKAEVIAVLPETKETILIIGVDPVTHVTRFIDEN